MDGEPSMEDVLNAGGHKDATFHLGATKVIVLTDDDGQTCLCRRDDGVGDTAVPMGRGEALEKFTNALAEVLAAGDVTPTMPATPAADTESRAPPAATR